MNLFSKKIDTQYDILLKEIKKTEIAMNSAYSNFENVLDPDLIDCYIYELNAIQKRYRFLLKQAKELDSNRSDFVEPIDCNN